MVDKKDNKTVNLNIRVSDGVKTELARLAEADRRNLSDYIRLQLEKLVMCNISVDVRFQGKHYRIPFHPQYEVQRLQEIQAHLLPLIEFLQGRFDQRGSIFMWWNDDTDSFADIFTFQTDGNISVPDVRKAINEYTAANSWKIELPS